MNIGKRYQSAFNTETGFYRREQDPFKCRAPELLDISITNKCTRECVHCYMKSSPDNEHFLTLDNLKLILTQAKAVYQVALGGGEPTLHPQFPEIIRMIKEDFHIVPNYTTNGDHLTEKVLKATKKYCGAVAVSYYTKKHTIEQTKRLIDYGIKTNWHMIVSHANIKDRIELLRKKDFPKGLNAIIFLLYKPVGRADPKDVLTKKDFKDLKSLINASITSGIKVGFDACFMNYLIRYHSFDKRLIDFCDSGRYSAYIDWNLNVKPCSFNPKVYGNLKKDSFHEIWDQNFKSYRKLQRNSICKGKCKLFKECYSGCPILPINLCGGPKKESEKE